MTLPKPYISYSACSLWKKDRAAFRRKYYEGEASFETRETIFGKKIAKMLEDDHSDLRHIPRYDKPEHKIEIDLDGIKVMGYLDSFGEKECCFLDYKTGHLSKDGKVPWDRVKVAKHEQLPFYSMLIKEKYGKVRNSCEIVWLETAFKKKKKFVMGNEMESDTEELYLTGKMVIFKRTVLEWERKKIKEDIKKIAKEISIDYETYCKRNGIHEKAREAVA